MSEKLVPVLLNGLPDGYRARVTRRDNNKVVFDGCVRGNIQPAVMLPEGVEYDIFIENPGKSWSKHYHVHVQKGGKFTGNIPKITLGMPRP